MTTVEGALGRGRTAPVMVWLLAALAGLAAGCDDFATPAELATVQVLAIRAEPPAVMPGERAELAILVADSDGPVAAPQVSWAITAAFPGAPLIGSVVGREDGTAEYTAPANVAETPVVGTVQATVHVDAPGSDGDLEAIKAVIVGDLPLVNPMVTGFVVDGQDGLAGEVIRLMRGQIALLELATEPAISDTSTFAWYHTAGDIVRYQSNPTEFATGEEAGMGWLIGVVRDGRGGIAWHAVDVIIE